MWVQGEIHGLFHKDGSLTVQTSNLTVIDGPRPRTFEASGADLQVFQRLWRYQETGEFEPGPFETLGYIGGATAVIVEPYWLNLLPDSLMTKLENKYGPMGSLMYLAEVRNTGAPTIWNVAEPSGGMAEDTNLAAEQMGETVELGVYKDDGWLSFELTGDMSKHQEKLDYEQKLWWNVVRPGFPCRHQAYIRFISIGKDFLDGRQGLIVAGPIGDFTHQAFAHLYLQNDGWKLLDTESRPGNHDKGEPDWVSLNRKIVGFTPREGKSPMMYEFASNGGLDHCGLHMAISGEAIEYNISHLSRAILGPRGLNWLR